ncbi:MAG: 50S ribosomal protein L3 [Candidatus Woesearchaeota archaeon]
MSKVDGPRHGSMQYWPRKRAKYSTPRIKSRLIPAGFQVDGFYGYKAGMTQVSFKDTGSNSLTKNQVIVRPVTIVECPPLKVAGIRFYKILDKNLIPCSDVFADKIDKDLSKAMIVPKAKEIKIEDYDDLRLIVYTQPKLTSLPKKKPEVFELGLAGTKEEKLAFAKEKLAKEIRLEDAFKQNELVDIHGITKGKGFNGPVKRFGIQIKAHKSEKTRRNPGSLGPWKGQQHIMYRVAHAGQTGYHLRTEFNKPIVLIDSDPSKINPKGGFLNYGDVKNSYLLLLGSIPGPRKRMLRLIHSQRPNPKKKTSSLQLLRINQESKQ